LLVVSLGFLAATAARATTVNPPSFSTLVSQSTQILRVEVVGSSSRWDTSQNGKVIHTYVQCSIQRTLKGYSTNSITLRFLGGTVGDDHMELPGLPVLEVGHSYILFVAKNGEAFCPIVAATHGSYPITTDAATKAETVLRASHEPLMSTDQISEPMGASQESPAGAPALAGMSREAFEDSIVGEVNRASTR
jgi:hypothetical protein